jgi:outer membrane lipase/esterase
MNLLANLERAVKVAVGALSLVVLAACGGGNRVEPFAPTRLLAFGDETSVIEDVGGNANGRKYTINALAADNVTLDCSSNAIWIQYLVATFSLVLPQCNPNAVADPKSRIYAVSGAKVADLAAQIDTHLLSDTFTGTDLVTVLIGQNDILEQYALYDGSNEAALTATLQAAGAAIAEQVNRIGNAGGKVIVSTVPDLGLTPFAVTEEAANAGRAALLSRLTAALNVKLRANLINDGRMIGLVLGDELVQTLVKFPSLYALVNVTTAACDAAKAAAVQDCTTQTLVTDATSAAWLWADATHLSPAGHKSLGQSAQSRATNNPF